MNIVAKLICLMLVIKGFIDMVRPSVSREAAEYYDSLPDKSKRAFGAFYLILGAIFIYLRGLYIEELLVHWIIALAGVYMLLMGIMIVILPEGVARINRWFYGEKGPTSLIGFILFAGGAALFLMI